MPESAVAKNVHPAPVSYIRFTRAERDMADRYAELKARISADQAELENIDKVLRPKFYPEGDVTKVPVARVARFGGKDVMVLGHGSARRIDPGIVRSLGYGDACTRLYEWDTLEYVR